MSAGAIQETPIRAFAWGKLVTLSDPFGNGFCLIDFPDLPYADQGIPGIDALPTDAADLTRSIRLLYLVPIDARPSPAIRREHGAQQHAALAVSKRLLVVF